MNRIIILFLLGTLAVNCRAQDSSYARVIPPKDPGKAFIYSAIPGAGQMHNDQVILGLGIFATEMALFGTAFLLEEDGGYEQTSIDALYGIAGTIYILQLIHAPLVAHLKNKKNGYIRKQSTKANFWVSLDPNSRQLLKVGLTF